MYQHDGNGFSALRRWCEIRLIETRYWEILIKSVILYVFESSSFSFQLILFLEKTRFAHWEIGFPSSRTSSYKIRVDLLIRFIERVSLRIFIIITNWEKKESKYWLSICATGRTGLWMAYEGGLLDKQFSSVRYILCKMRNYVRFHSSGKIEGHFVLLLKRSSFLAVKKRVSGCNLGGPKFLAPNLKSSLVLLLLSSSRLT